MREPAVGRFTPYELAFAGTEFEERAFPAIAEELETRGLDPARREEFGLAAAVGAALRDLVAPDAPPLAIEAYLATLFHAFHFWRAGRPVYCFEASVVRYWVEERPALEGWSCRAPHPALYLQWPRHLFWATVSEGQPPEPVDGFFLVAREAMYDGRGPFTEVEGLMAVGLRPGRAGFATIAFRCGLGPATVPADATWMFRSEMPGADLAGIYALERLPEAARLVEAALWTIERFPEALEVVPGAPDVRRGSAAVQGPTGLEHRVVRLPDRLSSGGGPGGAGSEAGGGGR
jgi:hypothetical protein